MGCPEREDNLSLETLHSSQIGRVAILRPLQLGDLLCAVPALRALRRGLPGAEVTLVGLPWSTEMRERFSAYIDRFMEFPGYPGLPEREPDFEAIPRFFAEAQSARFDLVVQMHGDGRISNHIAEEMGARQIAGFVGRGAEAPAGIFMEYPDGVHEIRRLLALVEFMGFETDGEYLEFPLRDEERQRARRLLEAHGVTGPYGCVHAGGRSLDRRWPPKAFARVADALAEHGMSVALTGSAAEGAINREVLGAMQQPAVDLSGATSLGELGALVEGAALLVTNDTGVSHVGAAVRAPSVVVFCGSDPARWAPLDSTLHRAVAGRAAGAGPSIPDVLDAAKDLLTGGVVNAS